MLSRALSSVHLRAEYFLAATACFARLEKTSRGCLVADTTAAEIDVVRFPQRLRTRNIRLPIIFLAHRPRPAMAVDALKQGAADFFEKPCNGQTLLDAIHRAIDFDRRGERYRALRRILLTRFETLTPREREVIEPMVKGWPNRKIASALGISEKTVETHRARVLEKTGVQNLSGLIRIALRSGLVD